MHLFKLRFLAIGLFALLSFNQAAHANLIKNPFYTGTATIATDWDNSSSAAGAGAAFNSNARPVNAQIIAAGGATEFYSGCVGTACLTFPLVINTSSGVQQAYTTAPGTAYLLSYWVYSSAASAPGGGVEIAVYNDNTKVSGAVPAGWSQQTAYLGVASSTSSILTTMIRDDPSYSAITYVDVEPIILRLSKTNPSSFAVGTPANYSFTINNVSTLTSGTSFTLLDQLPPNIQYNSAAVGTGLTGVSCSASGTVAAGQLVTCTVSTAGGITSGGSATMTINVTPLVASSGVSSINKASVQSNGAYPSVAGSTVPPAPPVPSTCTGTDTPFYGCAVATAIAPSSVSLTKTNPISFTAGVAANYSLTISNNLTVATAASFTLQDQLPPNIQFNSSAAGTGLTGAACLASGTVAAGQLLTCTITRVGGIPAGSTGSLTINVTPQVASLGVSGINKASVPSSGSGAGVVPSTCTATGTPAGCAVAAAITPAALSLTKTNPATLNVGTAANYSLTITNNSSAAVGTSFTLLDQLPPNIQYNSAAVGAGLTSVTCASSGTLVVGLLVTCTVTRTGGIPSSGTGTFTINVTPQAASAGILSINKASIPPSGTGSGVAASTCTATGSPAGCAVAPAITPTFLSLSKSNPASFAVGVAANYSLTITNNGGIASSASFTLKDQLPPNFQFNASAAGAGLTGAACVASGTVAAGQLLTCTITSAAGIPAAGSGTLTINVTPQAAAGGVASVNKATIPPSGIGAGGIPAACITNNNPVGCAVAPSITPGATLSLTKTNPAIFAVNVAADYTLTMSNTGGTATAASFTLLDQLPPNIQFNSATVGVGLTSISCAASGTVAAGQLVTCTINRTGGIPASGTGTLTINVTPQPASAGIAGINKASLPPSGTGTGVAPSTCTATGTPAGCAVAASLTPTTAQLTFTKTATPICDPFNSTTDPKNIPGAVVRWTLIISNTGNTSVNLANISDLLDGSTTFEPNLITGASTAAECLSAAPGVPENATGNGFKLAISGTPVAPATTLRSAGYPKYFTSAVDADAAAFNAGTVTINYALALPVEGVAPNAYLAGELKPGEVITLYFNVTVN